mmetsp:Transcript_98111/g.177128  ORF Transcript_98111/g.177128 Transcript_98111/m.177128 type:complete len:263 (-) Transcript_98111:521-1309(-)
MLRLPRGPATGLRGPRLCALFGVRNPALRTPAHGLSGFRDPGLACELEVVKAESLGLLLRLPVVPGLALVFLSVPLLLPLVPLLRPAGPVLLLWLILRCLLRLSRRKTILADLSQGLQLELHEMLLHDQLLPVPCDLREHGLLLLFQGQSQGLGPLISTSAGARRRAAVPVRLPVLVPGRAHARHRRRCRARLWARLRNLGVLCSGGRRWQHGRQLAHGPNGLRRRRCHQLVNSLLLLSDRWLQVLLLAFRFLCWLLCLCRG